MTRPVDIKDVVAMLAQKAEPFVREHLRGFRPDGDLYRGGNVAGDAGRSMVVWTRGEKQGEWFDWAEGKGGDMLDLVAQRLFGGSKGDALRWSLNWLGLVTGGEAPKFKAPAAAAPKKDDGPTPQQLRKTRQAVAIYHASQPKILGTLADRYFLGRKMEIARLPRQPGALRFHSALEYWIRREDETWEILGKFPAMVAGISAPGTGRLFACHRTYLQILNDGRVVKLDDMARPVVPDAKLTLGTYAGGCIRLWRGASGKPLHEALPGETAAITEGIEDGLTVALAKPSLRVLVAVTLSNLRALWLPPAVETVLLVAQNDKDDSPAARNLARAIARFQSEGRRVRVARPPQGVKDVNDMIRQGAA